MSEPGHDIVGELAGRLANPDSVRPWLTAPLSLSDGYPALALLYAVLGRTDASYRSVAHTYLERAAKAVARQNPIALYDGPLALAFAARVAARRPGDYLGLLTALDSRIIPAVEERIRPELSRISAGRAGTTFEAYDVISGLTGMGQYLLARGRPGRAALVEILGYLSALTQPMKLAGAQIPGWWVRHGPCRDDPRGHLNLGMAHGISGPLALLALSWEQGVRVEGQDEAAERICAWLIDMQGSDVHGPYWPGTLTGTERLDRLRTRDAWCYGVPGVARALQLAGRALGRPDWEKAAVTAMRALLSRPQATYGVTDTGLCHGWAGLLHLTWLIGRDAGDPVLVHGASRMTDRLIEGYDPTERFGFRTHPGSRPGFLEGAAGVALALHTYITGGAPAGGWDTALLVS